MLTTGARQEVASGRSDRDAARLALIAAAVCATALGALTAAASAARPTAFGSDGPDLGSSLVWTAIDLFLLWRVWRHRGRVARGLLIVLNGFVAAVAAFGFFTDLRTAAGCLLATGIWVALVLNPVRRHVGTLPTAR